MERSSAGRWLLTSQAVIIGLGGFLADWNDSHLLNPRWPPHARFHDAQCITLGLALLSLCFLWRRSADARQALSFAVLLQVLFWASLLGSFLFPGVALTDPDHADRNPVVVGVPINQVTMGLLCLVLIVLGAWLEQRRLSRAP